MKVHNTKSFLDRELEVKKHGDLNVFWRLWAAKRQSRFVTLWRERLHHPWCATRMWWAFVFWATKISNARVRDLFGELFLCLERRRGLRRSLSGFGKLSVISNRVIEKCLHGGCRMRWAVSMGLRGVDEGHLGGGARRGPSGVGGREHDGAIGANASSGNQIQA